jgi:hypothetical protein
MTTQAPIKNYAIAIASPLLKSPVAKMESDREEKISPCAFEIILL